LRKTFPEIPIVLVHRHDDACLGWWVKCGHFDITYPKYDQHYKNLKEMAAIIKQQNIGITNAAMHATHAPYDNLELCKLLNLALPPAEYQQVYAVADVKVVII
jgi:hypothetical protein